MLVSGKDRYGHFHHVEAPRGVMHPTNRELAHRAVTAGKIFLLGSVDNSVSSSYNLVVAFLLAVHNADRQLDASGALQI